MACNLVMIYRFVRTSKLYNIAALLLTVASMIMLAVTYTQHKDITGNTTSSTPDNSQSCYYDYSVNRWVNCGFGRKRDGVGGFAADQGLGIGMGFAMDKSLLLTLPILDGINM
jgi:hypothetical protein